MTVDVVERNSVVPADAKEIWKALMRLFFLFIAVTV